MKDEWDDPVFVVRFQQMALWIRLNHSIWKRTQFGDCCVTTAVVGFDRRRWQLRYKTRVYGGPLARKVECWVSSPAEAFARHERMAARVKAAIEKGDTTPLVRTKWSPAEAFARYRRMIAKKEAKENERST